MSVLASASQLSSLAYSIQDRSQSSKTIKFLSMVNESLQDDIFVFDSLVVSDPKNTRKHAQSLLDLRKSEEAELYINSVLES